nr:tape measure protein [Listeria aquatica]
MGLVKIASAAFNVLKSSIGDAVSRFDTMQKFPKVMKALGFSAEDSKKSINKLSDGIDGLPTKLDDVVSSTQQMTAITGDLDKSTDTVLALNNAFLASGAGTEDASRGMQQYNQMISTGQVDLESWKTLQETMPLALQKTAEAMGYTGKSAQRDLYAALKSGKVTFDDFQNNLIKLGTGTGMLAKLAKENSLGIGTSFGNLRNAVSKGVANVITKLDELTKKFTGKTIAQNIDSLKGLINNAFNSMTNSLDSIIPYVGMIGSAFSKMGEAIQNSGFVANLKFAAMWIKLAITNMVLQVKDRLPSIAKSFGNLWNKITPILTKIGGIIGTFATTVAYVLQYVIPLAIDVAKVAFDGLVNFVLPILDNIITVLWDMSAAVSEAIINYVVPALQLMIDWVNNNQSAVKILSGVIASLLAGFAAFKTISAALAVFQSFSKAISIVTSFAKTINLVVFAFNNVRKTAGLLKGALVALQVAFSVNPVVLLISVIAALVAGLVWFFTQTKTGQKIVQTAWEAIKTATGAVVDFLISSWQSVTEFLSGIWNWIKETAGSLWDGIVLIWQANVLALQIIWQSVATFFMNLWNTITTVATTAWNVFTTTIMSILQPFISIFMTMWTGISEGLSMIWEGIKNIAQGAWEMIKNVILGPILILIDLLTGDFEGAKEHLIQIWSNILSAGAQIWSGIKQVLSGLVQAAVSYIQGIWQGFKAFISGLWNGIKSLASSIWNGIKTLLIKLAIGIVNNIRNSWNVLKSVTSSVWNGIKSLASSVWNGIKSTVTKLANGIKQGAVNAWNGLKSATSKAFKAVVNFIKDPLKGIDLFKIGKDIIQGLINGIGSMAKAVGNKIKGIAGGIKDKIKGALGIHSPSRVMRDEVGRFIPQGIAVGIEADAKAVDKAMKNLVSLPKYSVEASIGVHGSKSLTAGTITNAVNVDNKKTVQALAVLGSKLDALIQKDTDVYISEKAVGKAASSYMGKEYRSVPGMTY